MNKGKLRPVATIVAQFAGGVEVDCIKENGKIYLPVMDSAMFEGDSDGSKKSSDEPVASAPAPIKKEEPKEEVKEAPKTETPKADEGDKVYTEKELMEMPADKILKLLKGMGVDPNDFDGKNTNKKLRDLYLAKINGTLDEAEKEEDEVTDGTTAKTPIKEDDGTLNYIIEYLEAFDDGKINKKKLLNNIMSLTDADVQKDVAKILDKFEDDDEAVLEDVADEILETFGGSTSKEDYVAIEDLEKGDRVSVWWDDDNKDWFNGVVKSVGKEGVTVAYDDDTEDILDPKINTKIKLID